MSFPVTEIQGQLFQSGTVTLDAAGNGVITLDPSNARQRWVVTSVVVSTNQAATATLVPVATVAKNTAIVSNLSQGNNRGASWSGNQDVFSGEIDISPADYLSVLFTPPPGSANTSGTGTGGARTSPATGTVILTTPTLPAGTYLVTWSVTLSGTLSGVDANNFAVDNGSVFVVSSVNTATAGTFPQTAVQVTVPSGGGVIKLVTGGNNGTSGSVYSGTLVATSPLSGVICYATVTGSIYTRRGLCPGGLTWSWP
jgi:hypothetical protein